jgi:hypothetical protein
MARLCELEDMAWMPPQPPRSGLGWAFPPEPKDMTINRPFFFGSDDRPTATWLFLGHVTDPS